MKTKRFLFTAGIALATAFTLSCSSDDKDSFPSCSELDKINIECESEYKSDDEAEDCFIERVCGNNSAADCEEYFNSCKEGDKGK